jgi:triphosphoribosyl-dephospho-CoA synthase
MDLSTHKIKFVQDLIKKSYINSCQLDIECIKPGNVNQTSGHPDTSSDDFIKSFMTTAEIISSNDSTLGEKIENSVLMTKRAVNKNTNLGIILLCSLFVQSLSLKKNLTLYEAIKFVVIEATSEDVSKLCNAIKLAQPGGLGSHSDYDVTSNPDIALLDIMKISSEYDMIAKQYALFFEDIFRFVIPALDNAFRKINDKKLAISYTFLKILEKYPDSHICRKYGNKIAKKTSNEASDLIKILDGDTRHESWGKKLMSLDNHFKMTRVNPGTSADLLVVSMMIYDYFIGLPDR